ncbi:hypothetical protein PN466_14235 [Roseofilum reptotaenium CS-1145]|uniref:O-antigen polymerase n=1 Tax=Roseofilum reptotaenium AO1-A TaxID=1925591 RepID=A0A1L9QW07_9CYAN|nr:hypothetical protein [Roseofilum reptotaenium]MDB9518106.1 hypothetical protein [Roseofilum reptotaenium CS-1145]OJJ26816.1 hypothetical protein BI308_03735 [Roseofilum reptotaenium AO1-A]
MERRELIQLIAFILLPGILFALLDGLTSGIFAGLAGAIMGFSYTYPALGLWAFLIYMPFAGTVTHTIANSNPLFHLVKDLFYIPALISILIHDRDYLKPFWQKIKPLYIPLISLVSIALVHFFWIGIIRESFNPTLGNQMLMGIVGLKTLLSYIPLMLCAYYLIYSKEELWFFLRLHTVLILICCALGFIQYLLLTKGICPGSRPLSGEFLYRATLQARCFIGGAVLYNPNAGLVRLPGTFVAPWQWGWFLISGLFFLFSTDVGDPQKKWKYISVFSTGLLIIMAVFSGQRIALALVPIIFMILQLLTTSKKKQLPLKWGVALVTSAVIIQTINRVEQRIDSLVDRWTVYPPLYFMRDQWQSVWSQQEGILGKGIGAATNAARKFAPTRLIETFHAKVLYEIGPLGLLAFLVVVSILVFLTYKAYRSLQKPSWKKIAICFWIFILIVSYFPYYYPLDVDPVAVYYWFIAGLLLKLPEIETSSTSL